MKYFEISRKSGDCHTTNLAVADGAQAWHTELILCNANIANLLFAVLDTKALNVSCTPSRPAVLSALISPRQAQCANSRRTAFSDPRAFRFTAHTFTMFSGPVIVDGKGHLLGRLASVIAKQALNGQEVIVVRCEQIDISGREHRNRRNFQSYLGKRTNTNPRWGPFHHRAPSKILMKAVRGMVPRKTKRGEAALARIKTFEGIPPEFSKKKRMVIPDALRVTHLRPGSSYTGLGRLAAEFGWKYAPLIRKMEAERKITSAADYEKKKALNKLKKKAVENADLSDVAPILSAAGY